jgi:hypothetical protein
MSEISDQPAAGKPPRPWYRRPTLMIVLIVLVVVVIASVLGGASDKSITTGAPARLAKVGAPVRDGRFEFTVTGVKSGVPSVGDQYLGKQAQGQFVLVTVQVRNIGDKAQTVFGSDQHIYDASGRRFDADTAAGISTNGASSQVFDAPINPGNSVSGTLVFDVPTDTTPTTIELHDSVFSGGTRVALY